jgi:hypothetical protein
LIIHLFKEKYLSFQLYLLQFAKAPNGSAGGISAVRVGQDYRRSSGIRQAIFVDFFVR